MVESPRNELKIVTITEFTRGLRTEPEGNDWYWHTQSPNGKIVGDSAEGYRNLADAIRGFFAQQGIDLSNTTLSSSYSKLVKVSNSEYHIRKYAYGAPDPFDANVPLAHASKGWVPPHADTATAE